MIKNFAGNTFNIYHVMTYLIPGVMVLSFIYWGAAGIAARPLPNPFAKSPDKYVYVMNAIFVLLSGYLVGHFVQIFSSVFETRLNRKMGWLSEKFLRDDDSYYTPAFKANIKKYAREVFDLPAEPRKADERALRKRRQEIFNLCYTLIQQENLGAQTYIFSSMYSLFRGMLGAVWVGLAVGALILLKHLLLLLPWWPAPTVDPIFEFRGLHIPVALVVLVVLGLLIRPLEYRFSLFRSHFVNSVYRSFYVWRKRLNFNRNKLEFTSVAQPSDQMGEL